MARAILIAFGLVLTAGLISAAKIKNSILNKCPDDVVKFAKDGKSWAKASWDISKMENKTRDEYGVDGYSIYNLTQHQSGDKFDIGITQISYVIQVPDRNDGYCDFTITILPRECVVSPLRDFEDHVTDVTITFLGNAGEQDSPQFEGLHYEEDQVFEYQDYFMKECNTGDFYFPPSSSHADRLELWRCSYAEDEEGVTYWQHVFGDISCSYCNHSMLFECDGTCRPSRLRCDGAIDCDDRSDEEDCPNPCGEGEFVCQSSRLCMPESSRCNFYAECSDGSDEWDCFSYELVIDDDELEVFVPLWRYDDLYLPGCYEDIAAWADSDEEIQDILCQQLGFQSSEGMVQVKKGNVNADSDGVLVVNSDLSLDYYSSCENGNKLVGLQCSLCERGEYQCWSGQCISDNFRCDYNNDCADGSDEFSCRTSVLGSVELDDDIFIDVDVPMWLDLSTGSYAAACYSELKALDDAALDEICVAFGFGISYVGIEKVKPNQVDSDTFMVQNDTRSFYEECPTNSKVAGLHCSACDLSTEFECADDLSCRSNSDRCNFNNDCSDASDEMDCFSFTVVTVEEDGVDVTYSIPLVYWPEINKNVPICDEGWHRSLNDQFCNMMGLGNSVDSGKTHKNDVDESKKGFAVVERDDDGNLSLTGYRDKSTGCDNDSNKVRTLVCDL